MIMKKLSLDELDRKDVDAFRRMPKLAVRLVLDNIRSGLNVGSAFRTADAFALHGITICGISAKPPHREILKTAIGATDSVEWTYSESALEAVRALKKAGWKICLVEQTDQSISLEKFRMRPGESYALVFGNEVRGISEELLAEADIALEIPQFGTKHSLNVSVCVGVLSWEFFRQQQAESGIREAI
ncbi:MAG: RNA methyltransferase [Saprospiraceae bacterium]|nr:RNA methyltransferase [Saprospiraceae bacterium]